MNKYIYIYIHTHLLGKIKASHAKLQGTPLRTLPHTHVSYDICKNIPFTQYIHTCMYIYLHTTHLLDEIKASHAKLQGTSLYIYTHIHTHTHTFLTKSKHRMQSCKGCLFELSLLPLHTLAEAFPNTCC